MHRIITTLVVSLLLWAAQTGCAGREKTPEPAESTAEATMVKEKIELTSPAFMGGGTILQRHTCDGMDVSPALNWGDPPAGSAAFALICDDPDAPVGTWVHWVIYNIPDTARGLPEAVPDTPQLEDGAVQGLSDFKRIGYGGPCPPPGKPHRYFFKLYALDSPVKLPAGATKSELLKAMEGHILAEGQTMGTYGR